MGENQQNEEETDFGADVTLAPLSRHPIETVPMEYIETWYRLIKDLDFPFLEREDEAFEVLERLVHQYKKGTIFDIYATEPTP